MAVTDKKMDRSAHTPKKHVHFEIVTAVSLAGVVVKSFRPGYGFQIAGVQSFCRTKAGAVSYVVKAGGRTAVAAGVFTAATRVDGTLSATVGNLKGTATEDITIELTTDGTGALTNGEVIVTLRPYPLGAGEV